MSEQSHEPSAPNSTDATSQEVDWLLFDIEWLVPCDEAMSRLPRGALAIDGDKLVAVGSSSNLKRHYHGRRELDLSGFLVLPGLINTHTHAAMTCFRGLGSDLPLQQWLQEVIFPAEAASVNPELVYHGTMLGTVEMLLGGVTTFCDGYFFEEAAARAVRDAGARAVLGQGILDFPTPDCPDPSQARERAKDFLEAFPTDSNRLRPSLFCHAPYTCGPETMQWVKELCRERDILFQFHLSETADEVESLTKQHGELPVQYLDRLGVLDAKTLCAHAVWLTSEEIDILALRQVAVSHTPESNMKLASGVAPLPELLAAGIKVGLGTDGCASNNNLDLLSEMDMAAKVQKVFRKDPVVCPARQILHMATLEGARTLSWSHEIGSLEVGKKADLIAIDANQPHLTPIYDPISHIVYAAKASDVRHVWVGGRHIVADGKINTVDVPSLLSHIARISGTQ